MSNVLTAEQIRALSQEEVVELAAKYSEEDLQKVAAEYAQPLYDQVDKSPDDNFDDSIVVRAISERLAANARAGIDDVVIEGTAHFYAFEVLALATEKLG